MFDLPPDTPKLWLPTKPAIIRPAQDIIKPPILNFVPGCAPSVAKRLPPASKSFIQNSTFSADASTYTATSVSFGAESARRYIVVGITVGGGDGSGATSVIIGGISAVSASASASNVPNNSQSGQLWIAAVPAGASGNVVANFSGGNKNRCGMAIWRAELSSGTPLDSGTDGADTGTTAAANCDVLAGSVAFGVTAEHSGTSGTTATWTGLTLDQTSDMEGTRYFSAASGSFGANEANRVMSAQWNASNGLVLAVASFK